MQDLEIQWSIEAHTDSLLGAVAAAGIDRNAIILGQIDAELIFPSFFCSSRAAWTKALAYLYVRNLQFSIYLSAKTASGQERWRYRLHPGMDQTMMALMREIDAEEAMALDQMQDRLAMVADHLRRTSIDDEDY